MLRLFLLLFLALTTSSSYCQFQDNFSDGNINNNPVWVGDTQLFRVNFSDELQLFDTAYSQTSSWISTSSKAIKNAGWEFKFQLDFNPSTSNYLRFYLVSDKLDVSGSLDGYYVQIGESGSNDRVRLMKQSGTSSSALINGRNGVVATAPKGWIKVTRDSLGNWELFSDTSLNRSGYISEGLALNDDFFESAYSGVLCRYTSTRDSLFYLDSILVTGTFYQDTTKPKIDSISVLSDSTLWLSFTEKVELSSGQNVSNFVVNNGIGNPVSAAIDGIDSSVLILRFAMKFSNLQENELVVSNVQDRTGNTMNTTNLKFTFFRFDTPSVRDVLINEIMCDPNPPVALPDNDWVELYNKSNKVFNLKNWEFSDRSSSGQVGLPDFVLKPLQHIVLCHRSDSAAMAAVSQGTILFLDKFPALNAGDDLLTLRDSVGNIVDQVEYDDSWYRSDDKNDGGFTLELINPHHPCPGSDNWIGSESLDGGTPGYRNSTYNTQTPSDQPKIERVVVNGDTSITLFLSRAIPRADLITGSYAITNGYTAAQVLVTTDPAQRVELVLSTRMMKGQQNEVSISGVSDCFGNTFDPTSAAFGIGRRPQRFEVVINELFPDPDQTKTSLPENEFIEVYNTTQDLISLDSCYLSDLSSYARIKGVEIGPESYVILCENNAVNAYSGYGIAYGVTSWPSLNNSGDRITLRLPDSSTIHAVNYTDEWYQNEDKSDGGWTLEMIDAKNPCGGISNWRASNNTNGGTPGGLNSIKGDNPDNTPPKMVSVEVVNENTIKLVYDEVISLSDPEKFSIVTFPGSGGQTKTIVDDFTVQVSYTKGFSARVLYEVASTGLVDCNGNQLIDEGQRLTFGLPEEANRKDVVINEVLFNPYSGYSSDYVEVYNRSPKIIELRNWSLCTYDYTLDTISSCKPVLETSKLFFPEEILLFSRNSSEVGKLYPTNDKTRFVQMESLPGFSNDEGVVILLNDSGKVIDRLDYDEEMHNALIRDPDGVSLERIDFERNTRDRTNWHSAAQTVGFGTPGLPNSQFIQATDFSSNFTLEPETFSPDNDGFDDILNINYEFDEPGFVANVDIHDADGRLIRQLVNSQLLEVKGSISWDGSTDNGERAKSGIYVVFFEVYHPDGQTQRFKKAAVVATKF